MKVESRRIAGRDMKVVNVKPRKVHAVRKPALSDERMPLEQIAGRLDAIEERMDSFAPAGMSIDIVELLNRIQMLEDRLDEQDGR